MAVQQDNFWHLFAGNLSFPAQTKHVFRVLSFTFIPAAGLAGKERTKPFTLKVIQQSNSGNVGVAFAPGFMLFFAEDAWHIMGQFVAGLWAVTTYKVACTKAAG